MSTGETTTSASEPATPETKPRDWRSIGLYILATHGLLIFGILLAVIFALLLPGTFAGIQTIRAILGNKHHGRAARHGRDAGHRRRQLRFVDRLFDRPHAHHRHEPHRLARHPWPIVVIITILAGGFVGWINGVLVEYAKIDSFIATLGVGTMLYGVGTFITNGTQVVGVVPIEFAPSTMAVSASPIHPSSSR